MADMGEISDARDVLDKVTAVLYGHQVGLGLNKRHPRASSKRHLARYPPTRDIRKTLYHGGLLQIFAK